MSLMKSLGYIYCLSLKYKRTLGTGCFVADIPLLLLGGLKSPQLRWKPAELLGQEVTFPQRAGDGSGAGDRECLCAWGWGALHVLPALRKGLASAREQPASSLQLRGLLARASRAVTGEGLWVEMLVGLEVSVPEQQAQDAGAGGAMQPGSGSASRSKENLIRFGTICREQSGRVKH